MKNFVKMLGIIAFVAVIGISLSACKDKKDKFDGTTWVSEGNVLALKFNKPRFQLIEIGTADVEGSGTYTISGSEVKFDANGYELTGKLSGNTLSLTFWGEEFKFTKQ
jgi:hypothetical protein